MVITHWGFLVSGYLILAPEQEVGMERSTSPYDSQKVKLILSVSQHHRAKFQAIAKMYGVSMNFLFTLIADEIYYDPIAPRLPQRIENAKDRVNTFFMKRYPAWKNHT